MEKHSVLRTLRVCVCVCVCVALVISMKCACATLFVACSALQNFSTLSHKGTVFDKKNLLNKKMCVLISSTALSETFLILSRTERDMFKNSQRSLCKVPLIIVIY